MQKFLLALVILALGVGGFVYLVQTRPRGEPLKVEEKAWSVAVETIQPQSLAPTLTLYGRVEAPRAATLRAALGAEVATLAVLEGQEVAAGDLLLHLDERDLRLTVQQRAADLAESEAGLASEDNAHAHNLAALPKDQALLALARKNVERARQLEKQRVGSQSALDEAQQAVERQGLQVNARQLEIQNHAQRVAQLRARRERAAALLEQARLDLARASVNAPFAGVVAKVMVAPGDRVRSGDALLALYARDALEVRAQLPATYQAAAADRLARGETLTARAQGNGHSAQLALERLAGEVRAGSGGLDGLFRVTAGAEGLRLGQFLELSLALPPEADAVAVPFEAVYGSRRVYKLLDGRMAKVDVERLGEYTDADGQTRLLVRSPELRAGDQLIVTQLPNALDGLKVQARQAPGPS